MIGSLGCLRAWGLGRRSGILSCGRQVEEKVLVVLKKFGGSGLSWICVA